MAKLVKSSDGSISLVHEEGTAEADKYKNEKQSHDKVQAIKKTKRNFKSLSQSEKDILIEHLLRIHDLI